MLLYLYVIIKVVNYGEYVILYYYHIDTDILTINTIYIILNIMIYITIL